jgi:hypothetical protein
VQQFPEYYARIPNPIDLRTIAERMRALEYRSLANMESDIITMCKNARAFNEPQSMIHKDAGVVMKFARTRRLELQDKGLFGINKNK